MIKLVGIELSKVLKHKSIYIIFFIIFLFCFFNDFLYKNDYDDQGNYKYEKAINIDKEIKNLQEKNKEYDVNKSSDKNIYVTNKSKIDIFMIQKKYSVNDWRYIKTYDYLYDVVNDMNYYKYIEKNEELYKESVKKYEDKLDKFRKNDWKYFINLEKKDINNRINSISIQINSTEDKEQKYKLENDKNALKNDLTIINYRLNNNIDYGNTYLNKALLEYRNNLDKYELYKNKTNMSYSEKLEYNKVLNDLNVNKYIISKKVNVNKENTLNYQLRTIVDDYELFIVIVILIVTSILVGEEFNKGTIKLLLIKPYSRDKILLSKYITSLIMILLVIFFIFLVQMVVGGILLGFDSLDIGMVLYNFDKNKVISVNIFIYMLIRILAKMPMLLIILSSGFVLEIILNNIIGSFSITMLLYTFSEVINNMAISYNLKFMRYFITLSWNFKDYLYGGLGQYKYINFEKAMLIFVIYDIILLVVMFVSFRQKNIKNI